MNRPWMAVFPNWDSHLEALFEW